MAVKWLQRTWAWIAASAASGGLLVLDPWSGGLDRGSILAIAGLSLATLAVTFGLVVVLAQHLAETYSRAVVRAVGRDAIWPIAVVGQACSVVLVAAVALWRPNLTLGAVAVILLAASLLEGWSSVRQLFGRFDPIHLITALRDDGLSGLERNQDRAQAAIGSSGAILNLILIAAGKGDVEVVSAGMTAWVATLTDYLRRVDVVWSDPYLYWLYPRCDELIHRYAQESVGLILPVITEGVVSLGVATATQVDRFNSAFDEGTMLFADVLKKVVVISKDAPQSTAADAAARGLGTIGQACIASSKYEVLQSPIDTLREVGLIARSGALHVASRATTELARLAIALARQGERLHLMCAEDAFSALQAIQAIVPAARGNLSPAHFLTAPMAENNLPLICQATARMAEATRQQTGSHVWEGAATVGAHLAVEIVEDPKTSAMVRHNAVEVAGCVVLGLIAVGAIRQQASLCLRIIRRLIQLALVDGGRLNAAGTLAEVLLAIYHLGSAEGGEPFVTLREAADAISKADERVRRRLSWISRQIGAVALARGDDGTARAMAQATLEDRENASKQLRTTADLFFPAGGIRPMGRVSRPGLEMPEIPRDYLSEEVQRAFLVLETSLRPSEPSA